MVSIMQVAIIAESRVRAELGLNGCLTSEDTGYCDRVLPGGDLDRHLGWVGTDVRGACTLWKWVNEARIGGRMTCQVTFSVGLTRIPYGLGSLTSHMLRVAVELRLTIVPNEGVCELLAT